MTMAHRDPQERATRLFDPEVGAQFQQRQSDTLVKAETEEARPSQEQPIPLLKIALMELPESRL